MLKTDFLVVGAGIIGLTMALEVKQRHPQATITILEKESSVGCHSSGRNSGVIHSGIYYPPGTIKAEVCIQGALEMKKFHRRHKLPLRETGKLLVVSDQHDAPQLEVLYHRAIEHGILVEWLDEKQLRLAEPESRSATGQALLVPSTSVGDPMGVMRVLEKQALDLGINIMYQSALISVDNNSKAIALGNGDILYFGHFINASGLHADTIAHMFGVGKEYTMLPFKGVYWQLNPQVNLQLNHLIYPVPDLRVPFLGVHTTTTVDGKVYFGPTAFPAFGRENYTGLTGIVITDLPRIVFLLSQQYIKNENSFRRLAWRESRRYFKRCFVEAVQSIVPNLRPEYLLSTSKVGIRAQMLNRKQGQLVNDFVVESKGNSTHILNAISPAWTSAFPFARHVCDNHLS